MNTNEEKGQINLHSSNWLLNSNFRQRFLIASQLTAIRGQFVLLETAEFCCCSSEKASLHVYFPPKAGFCTLIPQNECNHIKIHCYGSLFGKFWQQRKFLPILSLLVEIPCVIYVFHGYVPWDYTWIRLYIQGVRYSQLAFKAAVWMPHPQEGMKITLVVRQLSQTSYKLGIKLIPIRKQIIITLCSCTVDFRHDFIIYQSILLSIGSKGFLQFIEA